MGTTSTSEIVPRAEKHAKDGIFLSVYGFGMGNHNDAMLEQVSNKANGNYGFIDNAAEAKKTLSENDAYQGTRLSACQETMLSAHAAEFPTMETFASPSLRLHAAALLQPRDHRPHRRAVDLPDQAIA